MICKLKIDGKFKNQQLDLVVGFLKELEIAGVQVIDEVIVFKTENYKEINYKIFLFLKSIVCKEYVYLNIEK